VLDQAGGRQHPASRRNRAGDRVDSRHRAPLAWY
jgi:hypothetical protein